MENNMLKFTLDELNLIVSLLKIHADLCRENECYFREKCGDGSLAEWYKADTEKYEKLLHKIKTATDESLEG